MKACRGNDLSRDARASPMEGPHMAEQKKKETRPTKPNEGGGDGASASPEIAKKGKKIKEDIDKLLDLLALLRDLGTGGRTVAAALVGLGRPCFLLFLLCHVGPLHRACTRVARQVVTPARLHSNPNRHPLPRKKRESRGGGQRRKCLLRLSVWCSYEEARPTP